MILATLAISIQGCSFGEKVISTYPMMSEADGEGPWKLGTYELKEIYFKSMALEGLTIKTKEHEVFVNNKSQLIKKDGSPIRMANGKAIYWNNEGQIIDTSFQQIDESRLFTMGGRPLPTDTALTIMDFYTIKESGDDKVVSGDLKLYTPVM